MPAIAMGLLKPHSEGEWGRDGKLLGVGGTRTEQMPATGLVFASSTCGTVSWGL